MSKNGADIEVLGTDEVTNQRLSPLEKEIKKNPKKLNKGMSMQYNPSKSLEHDELLVPEAVSRPPLGDEEFFQPKLTEEAKKRMSGRFKPKYAPVVPETESERTESEVTSLDSDEEGCHLISTNDVKDMNFRCHREHTSDYRQQKVEEYLTFKMLNAIPIGVKALEVEVLTNLHLFLYHRLPSLEALATIKKSSLASTVATQALKTSLGGAALPKRDKEDKQPAPFLMRRVHCYGMGESFGELALHEDKTKGLRKARIVTITDCHFITVTRADYQRCLKKNEEKLVEDKVSFLRQLHFFRGWSKVRTRNQLANVMPKIKVHKNAVMIKEGGLNEHIYFVWKGEFQVRKKIHTDIPQTNDSVKEFLQGVTAKRSIRGIFNQKINNLTHKRGLTNSTEVLKDEDIFTLTEG